MIVSIDATAGSPLRAIAPAGRPAHHPASLGPESWPGPLAAGWPASAHLSGDVQWPGGLRAVPLGRGASHPNGRHRVRASSGHGTAAPRAPANAALPV